MMLHQDGSTHEWVADQIWDLIVTMDDATSEHYSMFFVAEGGTQSSFRGVRVKVAANATGTRSRRQHRGKRSAATTTRGRQSWSGDA